MGSSNDTPDLFLKNPGTEEAYRRLLDLVEGFPDVLVEEKKTCVHFVTAKKAFLGVHPRKDGVLITLPLTRPLPEDRIIKCEKASARRFYNDLLLKGGDQIDPNLEDWIREAYTLKREA